MDPAQISASVYPAVVLYAFVDLFLNRVITSAGLCLCPCTYIVMNFVSLSEESESLTG